MQKLVSARAKSFLAVGVLLGLTAMLGTASAWAEEKHEYRVAGTFVEGCSCDLVCPCATARISHGCQGVGAVSVTAGMYKGVDLAGAKFAYATSPGGWVRLYVDAKDPKQQEAVSAFAQAAFSAFGKIEEVKNAKIDLAGTGGKYTLTIDGGKIASLTTEPVLGADKKTPFTQSNTMIPVSPTIMQGKTLTGSFNDGGHSFTLANSNSYFNANAKSSGKM